MRHWELLGEASIPGETARLQLHRGKDDFHISITGGGELMNTRKHGSEDALGRLACRHLAADAPARVLIGGLGMGFTLAAALGAVGPQARVTVAELIPRVVSWNRGPLGERSGRPLDDPRTEVFEGDVVELLRERVRGFDAIALDVDNGPQGMTRAGNDWLYGEGGISEARDALRSGGVLAYWSAGPDRAFDRRLRKAGFPNVEQVTVFAHGKKGARHVIWLAGEGRRPSK